MKDYVSETTGACKNTAELSQGRQVEEGWRPLTFRATGEERIQLLAWKRTHNAKVSSRSSCPPELPPTRDSQEALSEGFLPALLRF